MKTISNHRLPWTAGSRPGAAQPRKFLRPAACLLLATAGLLAAAPARAADPRTLVDEYLKALGAQGYTIDSVTDAYVARTFPGTDFFSVWFQQWPLGVEPPAGLNPANIFYVQGGQAVPLIDPDELQDFFANQLSPITGTDDGADAGRTWLRLSREYSQDGFFTFSDPQAKVLLTPQGVWVEGNVTVTEGGCGGLRVWMAFDPFLGELADLEEGRKIKTGIRPICQATKLLDADPLVRRMAEQDLRVIGRKAKGYLDAQRAKARPELQQAIDRLWQRIVAEDR
jgi:hypothetical protein